MEPPRDKPEAINNPSQLRARLSRPEEGRSRDPDSILPRLVTRGEFYAMATTRATN
jgi:hypothetical protein